jgi:membrane fusion protein (multidrug efflux system)
MNSRPLFLTVGMSAAGWLLGSFLLSGCGGGDEKKSDNNNDSAAAAPAVITFPLQKGMLSSTLTVPGELIAWQQVDLYAKVNSFVKTLPVDIGSEVKQGDLLAVMEAPELTSQLDAAKSRVLSMQAVYLADKATYNRLYQTSLTPGTVSQNDLDQAAAKQQSDSAQVEAARYALREVEDNRNYLTLRAPFAGVISARNVNPGAYVGPSGKGSELPLFTLRQQSLLRLAVSVPEVYTSYLTSRDKVEFSVRSMPSRKFYAKVRRLAGAVDERLRSERVEMDVPNDDRKLLPGMVAEVIVPLPASDSTFVVPKSAVVNATEAVFVVKEVNGKAQWITVRTGREANGLIEIFGNLNQGDSLLLSASDEVRDGMPVGKVQGIAYSSAIDSAKTKAVGSNSTAAGSNTTNSADGSNSSGSNSGGSGSGSASGTGPSGSGSGGSGGSGSSGSGSSSNGGSSGKGGKGGKKG